MKAPLSNALRNHQRSIKNHTGDGFTIFFLLLLLWYLFRGIDSDTLTSLGIVFVSIVLEALPFMLVGSLVGGMIEVFVSKEHLTAMLPQRRWLSVFAAAGAGLIFPVCECAVVPVVRRLMGKGLPLSAAVAYLLGGPIVNPIVAASTAMAYAFDWPIMILRLLLGYGIAVVIGLLMGWVFGRSTAVKKVNYQFSGTTMLCSCGHRHEKDTVIDGNGSRMFSAVKTAMKDNGEYPHYDCNGSHWLKENGWIGKIGSAFHHATDDFLAVGHYLVMGAFIAALAQTHIERSSFLNIVQIPAASVGMMMVLAILLNLCSEADAFIAASFQGLMPMSAQMAFMLTGPMFDLKLLLMYQNIFQRKAIFCLAGFILAAVLGVSLGFDWINGIRL